jgi:hypothetical protein
MEFGIGLMIASAQISPTSTSGAPEQHAPTAKRKRLSAEPLTPVVHKKDSDVEGEDSKGDEAGETEAGVAGGGGGGGDDGGDDGGGDGGD